MEAQLVTNQGCMELRTSCASRTGDRQLRGRDVSQDGRQVTVEGHARLDVPKFDILGLS